MTRFEERISQNKISNFVKSNERKKMVVNNKVQEVRLQRDLFGRMLAISKDQNANIEKILTYPLTPVSMALCNLDGTICKTEKSALTKCLKVESSRSLIPDIIIIDGFYILHCMKDVPKTFGSISKKLLKTITNNRASEIHLIFDRYFQPSIKGYERSLRRSSSSDRNFVILGENQPRPTDFSKELRNSKFKEALINFIINHWSGQHLAEFIKDKTIFLNFDNCYSYEVVNGEVIKSVNVNFSCPDHEEADTKIVFHICKINRDANVLIKCSDTDILVILLGNLHTIKKNLNFSIEYGVSGKRTVIDVNEIYERLGESLCKALPGFHAFTGCDYNPSFFRRGKQRPYKILQQSEEYQKAFIELGKFFWDKYDVITVIEKFVCHLYNVISKDENDTPTVNRARFELFLRNYKIKNLNEPFQKKNIKNFDASSLPPCYSELEQQILRARYIANIWQTSHEAIPSQCEPQQHGWFLNENEVKYEFLWFTGDQLPSTVNDVILDDENNDNNIDEDMSDDDIDTSEDEDVLYESSDSEMDSFDN